MSINNYQNRESALDDSEQQIQKIKKQTKAHVHGVINGSIPRDDTLLWYFTPVEAFKVLEEFDTKLNAKLQYRFYKPNWEQSKRAGDYSSTSAMSLEDVADYIEQVSNQNQTRSTFGLPSLKIRCTLVDEFLNFSIALPSEDAFAIEF